MHVRWQPRNWAEARTFLSAGGAGEGGGGGGGGNGGQGMTAADILARYGASPERLAERLEKVYGENYDLREAKRSWATEKTALVAKLPPEGATVLTGDDAKAYDAYQALGKPDEVKSRLDEREQLATQVAEAQKGETLREVAELSGYKPAVLRRLGGDLDYVIKEATEDGKAVKRAFVKTESGEQPVTEYAEAEWGEFRESLIATSGGEGQRQQGVTFPRQGSGGAATPPVNVAQSYVNSTYKGPPKRG